MINHYVGGGFGCKGSPWSHVAHAAKAVGRPVKLVLTRAQMVSLVGHRRRTIQTITLAADAGGALTAIRHAVVSETSRFDQFVEPSAVQTRHLYSCPNVVTLMGRINQHVAAGVDALHPAVLWMIDLTCRGAARHGRPVGVCGGLASDPAARGAARRIGCHRALVHAGGRARREGRDTPGGSRGVSQARERGTRAGVTAGGSRPRERVEEIALPCMPRKPVVR